MAAIGSQQLLHLLLSLLVQVPLAEDLRIIESSRLIVRSQIQHSLQQKLRIVEDIPLDANARQEPHRFDVMSMLQQKGAGDLLGLRQFAVARTTQWP